MESFVEVNLLSPHRDDAAFSCGLLLTSLLTAGVSVNITNICTISEYAPYLAPNDEARVDQVTRTRAEEDRHFAHLLTEVANVDLGKIRFSDLRWKDAPIRRAMEEETVLRSQPDPTEIEALSKTLSAQSPNTLALAPLGMGRHVDHLLVRAAACHNNPPDMLLFYEDLPYASRLTPAEWAAMQEKSWVQPGVEWMSPAFTSSILKREYALCYPSQIAPSVAEEMEAYATTLGGRERFYGNPQVLEKIGDFFRNIGIEA